MVVQRHPVGPVPEPVVSRWGTWLEAAFWYASNFQSVREKVMGFEGNGALVTRVFMTVLSPGIQKELTLLYSDL